jgi:hypothetical protein
MNQRHPTSKLARASLCIAILAWLVPLAAFLHPLLQARSASTGGYIAYAIFLWAFIVFVVAAAPLAAVVAGVGLWRIRSAKQSGRILCLAALILAGLNIAVVVVPGSNIVNRNLQMQRCSVNLHVIDGTKLQFAHSTYASNGQAVAVGDILPYLSPEDAPSCPSEGAYTIGRTGELPRCSKHGELYSVHLQEPELDENEDRTR